MIHRSYSDKFSLLFIAFIVCLTAVSCSSNSSNNNSKGDEMDEEESSGTFSIPTTIKGKTLECAKIGWHELINNFTFTSSSSFTVDYGKQGDWLSLNGIPSYTYIKTGSNTATLTISYQTLCHSVENFTVTNSLKLTLKFTSNDTGTLSGTDQSKSYGKSIGTSISSYSYANEAFTLF